MLGQLRKVPGLHCERLTDRIQEGLPDCLVLVRKSQRVAMVELKAPRNQTGQVGLRRDQAVWIWRWTRAGGTALVLVVRPDLSWWVMMGSKDPGWPGLAVTGAARMYELIEGPDALPGAIDTRCVGAFVGGRRTVGMD